MALYNDGNGRYQEEYGVLWSNLVPNSGKASTIQGELTRVIGRLGSEYYGNGNLNWDDDFEKLAEWLRSILSDGALFSEAQLTQVNADIDLMVYNGQSGECPFEDEEDEFDRVTDRVVEFCRHYSQSVENTSNLPF